MTDLRTAAQQAVTMLKTGMPEYDAHDVLEVLEAALEQPRRHVSYVCPQCHWSLEQPEQEPVAWLNSRPLYYAPPRREWQSLTDAQIAEINMDCALVTPSDIYFARAIEAKLKEKNHE